MICRSAGNPVTQQENESGPVSKKLSDNPTVTEIETVASERSSSSLQTKASQRLPPDSNENLPRWLCLTCIVAVQASAIAIALFSAPSAFGIGLLFMSSG